MIDARKLVDRACKAVAAGDWKKVRATAELLEEHLGDPDTRMGVVLTRKELHRLFKAWADMADHLEGLEND